jgi:hypothetical protein
MRRCARISQSQREPASGTRSRNSALQMKFFLAVSVGVVVLGFPHPPRVRPASARTQRAYPGSLQERGPTRRRAVVEAPFGAGAGTPCWHNIVYSFSRDCGDGFYLYLRPQLVRPVARITTLT